MAAPPNTGMKKADMRKLLTRSKEEPVTCAVGQSDAGGLMLLDKRKPGRALETALKAEFPDARNTRWGTAFVDVDDNPKLVKLTLNKPVTGMAKRLIKTLKGTGFNKVIIVMEDGSVMEQFEEEDLEAPVDDGDAAPVAAAPAAEAPAATAVPPAAQVEPGVPPPPPPAPEPAAAAQNGAALAKQLAGLIPRIAGAAGGDPALAARLGKLAKDAGVNIKTGNLNYAALFIQQLETELANAKPAPAAAAPTKGGLGSRLSSLISELSKLPAGEHKAALTKIAAMAGGQIKAESLVEASASLDQLERELKAPPKAAEPAPTKGALGAKLSSLISQLGALPTGEHKAALTKIATEAGGQIKADDLANAADTLARLERALSAPPPPPTGASPGLAKLRADWTGVRDGVAADVGTLAKALAETYAGQPFAKEITDRFRAKVDPVLSRLDGRLGIAIDQVVSATDAAGRAQATAAAQAVLGEYQAVAADPFIADLDANPFVPLSIRSKTTAALAAVASALQSGNATSASR